MPKNNTGITPRGKYMLVLPDEPQVTKTSGGLSVPANTDKEQKAQGVVLAMGDEVKSDIQKGDVIIYGAYAGETLTINDGKKDIEYKLLHDDDVIAKIE